MAWHGGRALINIFSTITNCDEISSTYLKQYKEETSVHRNADSGRVIRSTRLVYPRTTRGAGTAKARGCISDRFRVIFPSCASRNDSPKRGTVSPKEWHRIPTNVLHR